MGATGAAGHVRDAPVPSLRELAEGEKNPSGAVPGVTDQSAGLMVTLALP
jgi:hypothetical protein